MNGIFDTHAHYDDERFNGDRSRVLEMIQHSGVTNVINVGCDIKTSKVSIDLSHTYDFIYAAIGIHPQYAKEVTNTYLQELENMVCDKVVAIGEIGLDYHYDQSSRDIQIKVFKEQLELADKINMPVIIHSREATLDSLEILGQYKPKGVVHCFSGSANTAETILKLGMYIGFTGVVTFKNANKTIKAVEAVPLKRILLETDCPYMAPVPHRGERTTSDMIVNTAEVIAKVKGIGVQELIDIARDNAKYLFLGTD